jgi:hypothetical protein
MNNSGDKWPEGYKGLVSAISPDVGVLSLVPVINTDTATLSWTFVNNDCIPISSYNIYENGQLIANVPYPTTSYNVLLNCGINDFYVTSVSLTTESEPSNIVSYKTNNQVTTTGNISYIGDYTYVTFLTSGTISFTCNTNIQFTLVGGGASGGTYSVYGCGTTGGGGGQILNTSPNQSIMVTSGNVLSINVGNGGIVPPPDSIGYFGDNTSITGLFSLAVSTDNSRYGGGGGRGLSNYSYNGGGGIGDDITSRPGGVYFVNSSTIGFGSAGAAGSLTNINTSGVISLVSKPIFSGTSAGDGTAGTGSDGFQGINGIYYGGGGGGGLYNTSYTGGAGGLGGGGSGAIGTSQSPVPGTANTGGGGGGGSNSTSPILPAAGGSGIAIIRFLT